MLLVIICFTISTEFAVRLVGAKGLSIPSDHRAVSLFAKARLVDAHGHSHTTDFVEDLTFQSPTVAVSPNPSFNDHKFVLHCSDKFDKHEFVRVELFLNYVAARASLGAIFIPLTYFHTKQDVYTFPVTKHTRSQHGIVPLAGSSAASGSAAPAAVNAADLVNISLDSVKSQLADLGSVTVKLERAERAEKARNAILDIAGSVRAAGLLDDIFLAECISASAHNAALDGVQVEYVSVAALPDTLKLIELERDSADVSRDTFVPSAPGRSSLSLSGKVENLHLTAASDKHISTKETLEFEIEVFENQRRTPYPPFDWSSSAITRPRFSNLDYSVSYAIDKISDANPPDGFVWDGDWMIDMEPLGPNTAGKDGWMYSFTFGKLLDNYKKRWSHTDPFNTHARRRRYVRKAKVYTQDSTVLSMTSRDALIGFQVANDKKHSSKSSSSTLNPGGLIIDAAANAASTAASLISSNSQSGSSQTAEVSIEEWRRRRADTGHILGCCEEKSGEFTAIVLQWEQVLYAEVVSNSVLLICVRINRCLGSPSRGYTFRPSDMHLFVSNCPAHDLKSLIDERKLLLKTRSNIRRLIASGNVFGQTSSINNATEGTDEIDEEAVPETEELSLASEIAAEIDSQISAMQAFVRKLERQREQLLRMLHVDESSSLGQSQKVGDNTTGKQSIVLRSEATRKEILILKRRLCRLRLYLAALYGVGLTGAHSFEETAIRQIVEVDLLRVKRITMEDAVSTANNRIEFLLDVAEKRIRDVALCGWKQPAMLQRCAEIFANCYLTEIINVLGAFFEDHQLIKIKVGCYICYSIVCYWFQIHVIFYFSRVWVERLN